MNANNLEIFRRSYVYSIEVHKITLKFPKIEQYGGMADQLRRSAKLIASNILEGYTKQNFHKNEFKRFLIISLGSCNETILWIEYAKDLGYINYQEYKKYKNSYNELSKMINAFIKNMI